jgi:hypothetical protein
MIVKAIERHDCADFILNIHYARRWPSISYAFGLFDNLGSLCGVVTYGTPASSTLRKGIAGEEFAYSILELNRLCLKVNIKNYASELVGKSLRLLPSRKIIISFADISQGHFGYVYQATNFIYCGLSAKRTDWKVKGLEHLHGITIADQFRGVKNRAEAMRDKYGSDFYLAPRPQKHRYIYLTGDKYFRKQILGVLRYPQKPYPKKQNALD